MFKHFLSINLIQKNSTDIFTFHDKTSYLIKFILLSKLLISYLACMVNTTNPNPDLQLVLSQMGSSTGNLPRYTEVFAAKLKLSAIEGLTTLRPLIKKSYELLIGIILFFDYKIPPLGYNDHFHHFVTLPFFYNYRRYVELYIYRCKALSY
jgi:hypothetical protein